MSDEPNLSSLQSVASLRPSRIRWFKASYQINNKFIFENLIPDMILSAKLAYLLVSTSGNGLSSLTQHWPELIRHHSGCSASAMIPLNAKLDSKQLTLSKEVSEPKKYSSQKSVKFDQIVQCIPAIVPSDIVSTLGWYQSSYTNYYWIQCEKSVIMPDILIKLKTEAIEYEVFQQMYGSLMP